MSMCICTHTYIQGFLAEKREKHWPADVTLSNPAPQSPLPPAHPAVAEVEPEGASGLLDAGGWSREGQLSLLRPGATALRVGRGGEPGRGCCGCPCPHPKAPAGGGTPTEPRVPPSKPASTASQPCLSESVPGGGVEDAPGRLLVDGSAAGKPSQNRCDPLAGSPLPSCPAGSSLQKAWSGHEKPCPAPPDSGGPQLVLLTLACLHHTRASPPPA